MRFCKIYILLFSCLFLTKLTVAQYQLTVKCTNTKDSIAFLRGVVYDDKNYIPKDTLKLYKGTTTAKYNKSIVGGIYFLYFPESKKKIYITLENNDKIELSFTGDNYLNTVRTNSDKNDSFFSYQKLETSLSNIDSAYEFQIKQGKKFNLAQKAAFFDAKNKELTGLRNKIMKTIKPASALYIYFDALNKLDSSVPNRRKYVDRVKFLNSINISSPKILFTPIVKQVVIEYLSYYPMQADSIEKGVDTIMNKIDCKSKVYPYVFDQLIKILKNREIQNNTIAYSNFINKYVKENKCKFLDQKVEQLLLSELDQLKLLTKQDTSINIILKDTAGINQNLHDFAKQHDFTLITFFDPTCEHCKVELPKMDSSLNLIETQLVLDIGKFTICNDMGNQPEVWKSFILEHKLSRNYLHTSLGNNNEIRKAYDAYTNPLFYLIDKEGRFIGKKISVNTIRKILISYLQK